MNGAPAVREILAELRETARAAAEAPSAERERILSRRGALRASLASTGDVGLPEALLEHFSHVRARIEHLEGSVTRPLTAAFEVLELDGDLCWIPLTSPEAPLDETVAAVTAALTALEPAAREIRPDDDGRALAAVAAARSRLTALLGDRLEERAQTILSDPEADLDRLCETYLEAEDLSIAGADTRTSRHPLRARIAERAESVPPEAAARVIGRFAEEAEDRALDVLAAQADLPPDRAAESLERGRRELVWMRRLIRDVVRIDWGGTDTEKEADARMCAWRRRLSRANRRLAREAQEARLQARLERNFGVRFTAFFENLILWLILAVLGILIVEGLIPDPHPAPGAAAAVLRRAERWRLVHQFLGWADAGICAVFLAEFFTKLALVRGRVSWFFRHFLVDLVPSIPYGLIAAHALDTLRAGRMIRFARVPRLLRYVRVARPFVRFFRFFGFLQRGMDRLVRMNGSLLNRNVVLFEGRPLAEADSPLASVRARRREVNALARRTWRRFAGEIAPTTASGWIVSFLERLPDASTLRPLPSRPTPAREDGRIVRAEEIVARLEALDAGSVEAELGEAGARRFAATLDRIDVPVVRLFPGLRQMVRAARGGEPLERVVQAGRALGRWLAGLLGVVAWFSDLSGVISGPQFLDRLGSAIVNATGRPARRLLVFGFGFLLLNGVVVLAWDVPDFRRDIDGQAYRIQADGGRWYLDEEGERVPYDPPALVALSDWLRRILGTPFLILGGGCLVLLLTGVWFRRIAGEATDFYTRTAEAQYINLLKSAKLANVEEDLSILWSRALRPEILLTGGETAAGPTKLLDRFRGDRLPAERGETVSDAWTEKILQLYHDYLDGALFHSSDTKTTSQLLGNLALENIRSERMKTSRRDRRRLDELDLDRERSALRGPYLWFRSINHSVAQWTARLLLEYNRHAIPGSERRDYPDHVVAAYEEWLDAKIRGDRPDGENGDLAAFVTTEFTALHFLTVDGDRDAAVRERFGDKTLAALRADRRAMIRTIFGTYPFHRLPRGDRTLNPFDLYGRFLAGGRAVFIPFYGVRLLFRGLRWTIRRIRQTLREILNPAKYERHREDNWASFDVAVRKINRMRKPLFLECVRFRAAFDPEYLGLRLLDEETSGVEGRTGAEDLETLSALDESQEYLTKLREERAAALRLLAEEAAAAGGPRTWLNRLREEGRAAPWREAWRAVAIAWAIDYRDARTLASLRETSAGIIAEVVARRGRVAGTGVARRLLRALVPARGLHRRYREFLVRSGSTDLRRRERRMVWRAVRAGYRELDRLVELAAALEPGTTPAAASRAILRDVARHPESWSEQLVTLRTVQSLSVLDVRNYRRQVEDLGGYRDEPARGIPARA